MPKIIAELSFELSPNPERTWKHRATINVPNLNIYLRFKQLGLKELWFRENEFKGLPGGKLKAVYSIDSDEWQQLKEIIVQELHLVEKASSFVDDDELNVHYAPYIHAEYSKKELGEAEYLRLKPVWGKEIGHFDHQNEDEQYVVALDGRQKNKHQFGVLFPADTFAFANPLKSQLEQAGLKHLCFESILLAEQHLLDERQRAGPDTAPVIIGATNDQILKPLWKLSSDLVLPRFLYPLFTDNHSPFTGDLTHGCGYDNGNSGLGLKYSRREIEELGLFDVAVTMERLGTHKDRCFRSVIVSQKFRRTMIQLGIKAAEYEPVILEK